MTAMCLMVRYLPNFRHHVCAQTPGGTITEFNKSLVDIFGEEALLIEKNPALSNCYVSLCNAGNGLTWKKTIGHINEKGVMNTKQLYMTIESIDEVTKEEYATFHRYLRAFPTNCVCGIGTKAIYGPPGESDLAQSYDGMVHLLQVLHSEAAWTYDSRVQIATVTKTKEPDWKHEDKFHGDCEFKTRSHVAK